MCNRKEKRYKKTMRVCRRIFNDDADTPRECDILLSKMIRNYNCNCVPCMPVVMNSGSLENLSFQQFANPFAELSSIDSNLEEPKAVLGLTGDYFDSSPEHNGKMYIYDRRDKITRHNTSMPTVYTGDPNEDYKSIFSLQNTDEFHDCHKATFEGNGSKSQTFGRFIYPLHQTMNNSFDEIRQILTGEFYTSFADNSRDDLLSKDNQSMYTVSQGATPTLNISPNFIVSPQAISFLNSSPEFTVTPQVSSTPNPLPEFTLIPQATSTPNASPEFQNYEERKARLDRDLESLENRTGIKRFRYFLSEEEEAVYYLITKYLID